MLADVARLPVADAAIVKEFRSNERLGCGSIVSRADRAATGEYGETYGEEGAEK